MHFDCVQTTNANELQIGIRFEGVAFVSYINSRKYYSIEKTEYRRSSDCMK